MKQALKRLVVLGTGNRCFGKLLLVLCFLSLNANAQPPDSIVATSPPKLVNDFAEVMSFSSIGWLEDKLVQYDKESSTQIQVITVKTLAGYDVADYTVRVANKWGIGQAAKDNGVLLLTCPSERKVHIAVGRGLEASLTDIECSEIIQNELLPSFRDQYYYEGIDKATTAILTATKGEYKAEKGAYGSKGDGLPRWLIILILIVGINGVFIGIPLLYRYLYWKITGKRLKYTPGTYTYSTQSVTQHPSSGSSSSSSSGSSQRFGGYGGGSFGGGGASGSW